MEQVAKEINAIWWEKWYVRAVQSHAPYRNINITDNGQQIKIDLLISTSCCFSTGLNTISMYTQGMDIWRSCNPILFLYLKGKFRAPPIFIKSEIVRIALCVLIYNLKGVCIHTTVQLQIGIDSRCLNKWIQRKFFGFIILWLHHPFVSPFKRDINILLLSSSLNMLNMPSLP